MPGKKYNEYQEEISQAVIHTNLIFYSDGKLQKFQPHSFTGGNAKQYELSVFLCHYFREYATFKTDPVFYFRIFLQG